MRRMPPKVHLGNHVMSTMAHCMGVRKETGHTGPMGFYLPTWQRPLVWTEAQMIAFIESAWRGINIGTYAYNVAPIDHPFDYLLIDGQQRMTAIQRYLDDTFPVFGYRWSEVTDADRRHWSMTTIFASYITETTDEQWLRDYYNMTNFGGTAHTEAQRA